ncbi:MAG: P1 family peptidase [Acidimicrobiia bacterium]
MITDVPGVRVGHWTDATARTGCTVVLFPQGTVGSGEVRGGAPATRDFALLEPTRTVDRLDAVVLTGGSTFGLAAVDGVLAWCEERGTGLPTVAGPVPIVVGLGLYDLVEGDPSVRPGPAQGRAACEAATGGAFEVGRCGAGTGATVAKWRGSDRRRPGGLVTATRRREDLVVAVLLAVNAFGEPGADPGEVAATLVPPSPLGASWHQNTTIGVVATNATLDKVGCRLVAEGAHDGLARALVPVHTRGDGDAVIVAATGAAGPDLDVVRALAVAAVVDAVEALP